MSSFVLENDWMLTTEHEACDGVVPVLCHGGHVYHAADHEGGPAHRVAAWAYVLLRTRPFAEIPGELAAAQAFLQQWPDGPQLSFSELAEFSAEPTESD